MSDWSAKQFAMELIARGVCSVGGAMLLVRDFERQWQPEEARLRSRAQAFETLLRKLPAHATPEQEQAWLKETKAQIDEAGERAFHETKDLL